MIDDLKFVQGAVAKKDILPALTHFLIKDGRIQGYNGRIALSSPISLTIDCQPKAVDFVKAIQTCESTVHLNLTPSGRLAVKSGKFKAHINCVQEDYPFVQPEGQRIELTNGILPALKKLEPLIAEDASRPWARSILLRDQFAIATNNVVICQYWLGYKFPIELGIPHEAVNELIRIGVEPIAMQIATNSVTFHFENDRWLRTQTTLTDQWPDIGKALDRNKPDPYPLPESFFNDLEILRPFVDDLNRCFFVDGGMTTHIQDGEGAFVEFITGETSAFPENVVFNLNMLRLLNGLATSVDFSVTPGMFFGENLRGAIAPMRT